MTLEELNAKYGKPAATQNSNSIASLWGEPAVPTIPKQNLEQKIKDSVKNRFSNASKIIAGNTPESQGEPGLTRAVQATAEGFGVIPDTASNVIDAIAPNRKAKYEEAKAKADSNLEKMGIKTHEAKQLSDTYNQFVEKANEKGKRTGIQVIADYLNQHPEQSKNVDTVLKTLGATGEVASDILIADVGVGAGQKGIDVAKTTVKDLTTKAPVTAAKDTVKDLTLLQEKISPKLTAKETQIAQSEGRIVKGKKATFLKSGTEDTVLPSEKVIKASKTIEKQIPGATTMDEPTLLAAIDNKTTEIAKQLKPKMSRTKIKPKTVQKINDDWTTLKEKQIADAPATEEVNVAKRQARFEKYLQKSGNKNMNDLWETAKNYDASIPENVKKANSLSSESLQLQRQEWLQNRAILRDALTDSTSNLGEASEKAFADMYDMYNAKENLMSKAKVETNVEESGLIKTLKHPAVKYGVGGTAIYQGGKALLGD